MQYCIVLLKNKKLSNMFRIGPHPINVVCFVWCKAGAYTRNPRFSRDTPLSFISPSLDRIFHYMTWAASAANLLAF